MVTPEKLAKEAGLTWFDYQEEAFAEWAKQPEPQRLLLYYRTGAGKTITSLALLRLAGHNHALVIAPPATHAAWEKAAKQLGCFITTVSHAKFRAEKFKPSRTTAIIADEFHLFGGHKAVGFTKMNIVAKYLKAPLILASATPNYNDAERVYCIQSTLDPLSVRGGFLQFLYRNCITRENPFATTPEVLEFTDYDSAADYLADLPNVVYLPDLRELDPIDVTWQIPLPDEYTLYGVDPERERIIASQMEQRHRTGYFMRTEGGRIRPEILSVMLRYLADQDKPVLIFSASAILAEILQADLANAGVSGLLVTGTTTNSAKARTLDDFRTGKYQVLVGTATLATGVDGLDRVCDSMIIFDDTADDAMRKQLIGRILPRGASADMSRKEVMRYLYE